MFQSVTTEFLSKYSELLKGAAEGKDTFGNELSESMIKEFDLQAVVIFKVIDGDSLLVIGRSDSANASFLMNSKFRCGVCENLKKSTSFSINSDSNCELAISEYLIYESCVLLITPNGERLLMKVAKKSAFNQSDSDALKKISPFYSYLLHIWLQSRNGLTPLTDLSFSKLVDHSTVSLRNSANSILGITSILGEENLTASQLEYVNNIKRNSQAMLVSINDLKALSLIESGETKVKLENIDLKKLLSETINIFKTRRGNLPTSINLIYDDKLPQQLKLDQLKLKYIVSSLLRISTHLTGGRNVELKAEVGSPGFLELLFELPNKSLAQDTISHFFNPFKVSANPEMKGCLISGLETNLLKKYSQLLGGDLNIDSKASAGTIFKLRIPIEEGAAKLSQSFASIPKPTEGHNNVLVIEDDYATSKLMSNYLKKWGYEPTVVNTEDQVLNLIDRVNYLAVILDIEIPNVNGLELLRKINTHPKTKNTPVIVCSVEPEQQKAYMMGAVEYFVKPINYNYLVEVLTSYKLRKDSNVLCVDDDVPTLNLVKQAIETAGFNAIAEHISANVMDLIKDKEIDLAII
ncbi:MAG: response regulator, partial [Ignavibacteria bacterium]